MIAQCTPNVFVGIMIEWTYIANQKVTNFWLWVYGMKKIKNTKRLQMKINKIAIKIINNW